MSARHNVSAVNLPSTRAVTIAVIAGLANVAVVVGLYARDGYPVLESASATAVLVVTAFLVGFVPAVLSIHTRLIAPIVGFFALLVGVGFLEATTPSPEWGELGGSVVVDGPTHVGSYANTWSLWVALLCYAGALEFGLRRGYGLADGRLRNLPSLPLDRRSVTGASLGVAGLVGLATALLVLRAGIRPPAAAGVVFVFATAVAAVPLAGLLARRLLAPAVLFAIPVPYLLVFEAFVTTDSPVHILLFGPYAVVLALVGALEAVVRARRADEAGGRFTRNRS